MPCPPPESLADREARLRLEAIDELEQQLEEGSATIYLDPYGNYSIEGWNQRGEWCDACAINHMINNSDNANVIMMIQSAQSNDYVKSHGH